MQNFRWVVAGIVEVAEDVDIVAVAVAIDQRGK